MTDFAQSEARREVAQLHRLAMDALDEDHYATMERLLEQAVRTAQQLDDLPVLVQERYWLATAQRMQGKDVAAMTTYTWLIGLATDPAQSRQVADDESLEYLARAFQDFVAAGKFLPALPVERLLGVVADGMGWLERVGKREWMAGLRLQRGSLLRSQGEVTDARQELEAALALERRHPEAPGYTLATYQLELADLLREEFDEPAEAKALAEAVLAAAGSSPYDRRRAWTTLAYAQLDLGERTQAEQAAREALALAHQMESPGAVYLAYEVLGRIQREAGQLAAAVGTMARAWHWARRDESVEYRQNALAGCARVRLLQARQACGLAPQWGALPAGLPPSADRPLARRWLRSARQWLRWAQPLAQQQDRAAGQRSSQDDLDTLLREVDTFAALLEQHTNL